MAKNKGDDEHRPGAVRNVQNFLATYLGISDNKSLWGWGEE